MKQISVPVTVATEMFINIASSIAETKITGMRSDLKAMAIKINTAAMLIAFVTLKSRSAIVTSSSYKIFSPVTQPLES